MEGGSPVLEWITYAIIGLVLLAMLALALRTVSVVLSILAIPLTSTLSRIPAVRRGLHRWGMRGADALPGGVDASDAEAARVEAARAAAEAERPQVPAAVRRGMTTGAVAGALPGVWMAVHGATTALDAGASVGSVAASVGLALGLVASAGVIAGGALGVVAGIAVDAVRARGRQGGEAR